MAHLNVAHRSAIRRFEEACRSHEMMGAAHPQDHKHIQDEYDHAKHNLEELIVRLYVTKFEKKHGPKP